MGAGRSRSEVRVKRSSAVGLCGPRHDWGWEACWTRPLAQRESQGMIWKGRVNRTLQGSSRLDGAPAGVACIPRMLLALKCGFLGLT